MTALLIVGHGTRDADGAQDFRAFVQRVARRAPEALGRWTAASSSCPRRRSATP